MLCFFLILIAENEDPSQNDIVQGTRRILSTKGRWEIFSALLEKCVDGKLKKKIIQEKFHHLFSVPIWTIQRIWRRAIETSDNGKVDVSQRRTGNCGCKRISLDMDQVASVPLHKRTTLRTLSMALGLEHYIGVRRKELFDVI